MIGELIILLIGIILGANLHQHINPLLDGIWEKIKAALAKTA